MLAIGHGCEVTLLEQKTLCMSNCIRDPSPVMKIDSAHWENIRTLPDPPDFTTALPAPNSRALHFTKEGHLIAVYLDHGIVSAVFLMVSERCTDYPAGVGIRFQ